MSSRDFLMVFVVTATLVISRLIPHAPNFTASLAGLIFGAVIIRHSIGLVMILLSYFLADLLINYFQYGTLGVGLGQVYWIYFPLAVIYFFNRMMTENSHPPFKLFSLSLISSLFFFILTNIGVWGSSSMYTKDFHGLLQCFTLALPFFVNEISGTIFYTLLMFAVYWNYNKVEEFQYVFGGKTRH
ncbi:MAG: hypothetical protein IPM48_11660 [Saprospiraceae bacterium]|nr:hypothetical protein [Saprospiraceae bacterium]